MYEAVKVALDPTPRQERLLEGHAGAARFAYNTMLSRIQSQLARGE
ncbi:helix-turn-helix domain-containing protein, partial [Bifidobacterium pseudolongum]